MCGPIGFQGDQINSITEYIGRVERRDGRRYVDELLMTGETENHLNPETIVGRLRGRSVLACELVLVLPETKTNPQQ